MIEKNDLKTILTEAVQAPSGGNSQPWGFESTRGELIVKAYPEKDNHILNFKNRGTLVAHGALIENIVIVASHYEYAAKVELFPETTNNAVIAKILFSKKSLNPDDLYASVSSRTTNRKPYQTTPLTDKERRLLLDSIRDNGGVRLLFEESRSNIDELSQAISKGEIVMLENNVLHNLFFDEVTWSEEEEMEKRTGFYLKTLELQPAQEFMFKRFRHWSIMKAFNLMGVSKKIAQENAKLYASAGAIGAIVIPDSDEHFIAAGRALQRMWLSATSCNLHLQLMTGVLFLGQKFNAGDTLNFLPRHVTLITKSYREIQSIFQIDDTRVIPLLFRIGHANPPTALALKKEPEITFA